MTLLGGRLRISGGFLLETALLYYLDAQQILPWVALAATAHELGHYLAIRLCGGRVLFLRLSCAGAELRLAARCPLSPTGELFAALAGPGINLLLALLTARFLPARAENAALFAGLNLALAAFNLLPIAPLDGGRALRALLAFRRTGADADRLLRVCSVSIALALAIGGGILVCTRRAHVTLFATALWLLFTALRRDRPAAALRAV